MLLDGSESATVGDDLNFRFHMLFKSAMCIYLPLLVSILKKNGSYKWSVELKIGKYHKDQIYNNLSALNAQ